MIPGLNYTGIVISRVNVHRSPRWKYGDHGEKIWADGKHITPQVYVDVRGLNKLEPEDVVYISCEGALDTTNEIKGEFIGRVCCRNDDKTYQVKLLCSHEPAALSLIKPGNIVCTHSSLHQLLEDNVKKPCVSYSICNNKLRMLTKLNIFKFGNGWLNSVLIHGAPDPIITHFTTNLELAEGVDEWIKENRVAHSKAKEKVARALEFIKKKEAVKKLALDQKKQLTSTPIPSLDNFRDNFPTCHCPAPPPCENEDASHLNELIFLMEV